MVVPHVSVWLCSGDAPQQAMQNMTLQTLRSQIPPEAEPECTVDCYYVDIIITDIRSAHRAYTDIKEHQIIRTNITLSYMLTW